MRAVFPLVAIFLLVVAVNLLVITGPTPEDTRINKAAGFGGLALAIFGLFVGEIWS